MAINKPPLLLLTGIRKSFGPVEVLKGIDFHVDEAEVVALLGDNGAGKTTLVKVITGAHQADAGEIHLEGRRVHIRTPADAQALGIETIYQDLALHNNIDVCGNVFMGREPRRFFFVLDQKKMAEESTKLLRSLDIHIDRVTVPVSSLSGGQRQAVAIARAIYWNARLIIMDEPTAALAVPEQKKVLQLIKDLKAKGLSIILISHNVQQVLDVVDRVVVIRRGQVAGISKVLDTSVEKIVDLMVR